MSQDEHPQKCARARHKARTKEGSNNAHGRHCTNRSATAPTRRDTPKGSKTKSPFCVVLKTYHLTGIHHKTCLKYSNLLNRKLCVQLLPTWNTMATARGQGNRRKNKIRQNELRQGSKHGNYNMPPRLIGRDPELRPVHQISGFHFTHGICLILPRLQNLGARANKAIAALNRIAMSGTHVNTRCANKGNKIIGKHFAKRGKQQHRSPNMDQHEFSRTAGNK